MNQITNLEKEGVSPRKILDYIDNLIELNHILSSIEDPNFPSYDNVRQKYEEENMLLLNYKEKIIQVNKM